MRKQAQPQTAAAQPEAVTAERPRPSGPAPAAPAPAASAAVSTMHRFLRKASQSHYCSSQAVFWISVSLVAAYLELVTLTATPGHECVTHQQNALRQAMHWLDNPIHTSQFTACYR